MQWPLLLHLGFLSDDQTGQAILSKLRPFLNPSVHCTLFCIIVRCAAQWSDNHILTKWCLILLVPTGHIHGYPNTTDYIPCAALDIPVTVLQLPICTSSPLHRFHPAPNPGPSGNLQSSICFLNLWVYFCFVCLFIFFFGFISEVPPSLSNVTSVYRTKMLAECLTGLLCTLSYTKGM